MKVALCTPLPASNSIFTWQKLLDNKGHDVRMVYEPIFWKPDVVLYYGSIRAKAQSVEKAKQARDSFSQAKVINDFQAFDLVRDKQRCGDIFDLCGINHPTLKPTKDQRVVAKPRFGFGGQGVVCNTSFEEAKKIQSQNQDYLIQEYIEGQTIRVICSKRRALYAYEKVSDSPLASVAQGAKRKWTNISPELEKIATKAVCVLGADLLGLDIIKTKTQYWVLEANTGFALYSKDIHTQSSLAEEFQWLAFN